MKILFDHQIFDTQEFGGISRYFFELFKQYEADDLVQPELALVHSNNEYLKMLPSIHDHLLPKKRMADHYKNFFWGADFKGKDLLFRGRNKFFPAYIANVEFEKNKAYSIQKIKEGNFDIFHPTYYDNYFLEFIGNKPYVLTVYDLIHQVFPDNFQYDKGDKSKEILQRAAKIIAISHSTKRDLVSFFDVPEEKIHVTYLANSLKKSLVPLDAFKAGLPKKYLLYVGNRNLYKNFLFFAQAVKVLFAQDHDLHLMLTGPSVNHHENWFFIKDNMRDRVHHLYVDDAQLTCLYENALAFVFPSMYEGFGLPVLEAFSCGCPVVTTDVSSLPEVGGDAALYFEPKNITSLISALRTAIYDDEARNHLRKSGLTQLKKFSWEKTAAETKEVYDQILMEKRDTRASSNSAKVSEV